MPAVDPDRDRLPDLLVVERRERVVESKVEDVQPGARQHGQGDVIGHRRDTCRDDAVDAVDGPVLELLDSLR